jgi:hypothetical protein
MSASPALTKPSADAWTKTRPGLPGGRTIPRAFPWKTLLYPALLFDGQLKTRQAPGTSSEPYLIPVLGGPKKIIQVLDRLRDLKSFPSPEAVNTTTGPQLPKYVSAAFGSLDLP